MDTDIPPSTLALLLDDFETQHGRFTDKKPNEDKQVIALDELLKLEQVFKKRCVDAIDSGTALSQYGGLSFLWMLSQIDEELVKNIKKTLITDDVSLAKVISYCTSHGKTAVTLVVKIRKVNKQSLSEFIDIEEAYRRISAFVTTRDFLLLPENYQMDVVAFLITMEKGTVNSLTENSFAEDVIKRELYKILNKV